jgi:hypothetical protein
MAATGELLPEDLEETLASFGNAVDNIDLLLQPLIDADFSSLQVCCAPLLMILPLAFEQLRRCPLHMLNRTECPPGTAFA